MLRVSQGKNRNAPHFSRGETGERRMFERRGVAEKGGTQRENFLARFCGKCQTGRSPSLL